MGRLASSVTAGFSNHHCEQSVFTGCAVGTSKAVLAGVGCRVGHLKGTADASLVVLENKQDKTHVLASACSQQIFDLL